MAKQPQSIDDKLDVAEQYRNLIEKSNNAAREKDYSTALRLADEALKVNPQRYEAYFAKGGALTFTRNYTEAEAMLTLGINIMTDLNKSSRVFLAYFYRGIARMHQKKYDLAESDFTRVIELNHDYKLAYDARAKVRTFLGRNEDAKEDIDKGSLLQTAILRRAFE